MPQPIVQNSVPATATLDNTTIGASVVYALPQGSAAVGVQLVTSGSVSSASVQCSIDGVNYTNIPIYSLTAAGIVQTITSSPFYGIVPTAGCMDVDVVTNNVGGGTSAITFFNAPATNLTSFISSLPSGSNTIGNVGLSRPSNTDTGSATSTGAVAIQGYNGTSWSRVGVTHPGTSITSSNYTLGVQGVTNGVPLSTLPNGSLTNSLLTSSTSTSCTNLAAVAGQVAELVNASTTGQSVTLSLYNESSASCSSADLVYSVQLGASQIVTLNLPMATGITYQLSGSLSSGANIDLVYLP